MITLLLDKQMKLVMTSELEFFKCSLMLAIILCTDLVINSALDFVIGMMTSFLDGPLVIIFNLGFFLPLLPFLTFKILLTSLANKDRKASFTRRMLLTFEVLDLEACAYNFFMLEGLGTFWGTTDTWGGGAGTGFGGGEGTAIFDGREVEGGEGFSTVLLFASLSFIYLGIIFLPTSLQMLLSLIGRRSHLEVYIIAIRPQRALTTSANSLAGGFLSARLCLK